MTDRNWAWEAKNLLPHLAGMLGAGVTVQAGGGGLVAHALNSSTWHTGTLNESQAPWAVTSTVYDAHVANANAHHAKLHNINDSAHHTLPLSWGNLSKVGSDLADLQTRTPGRLDGTGGAALDVVGWTGTDAIGRLIPSADVSAGASAILRSNAGALGVNVLTAAGTGAKVRTPLLDTASGNMAISPAVDLVLSPVTDVTLNPGGWVELANGKTLRTASFASGFAGNGLRLDQGVSVADQTSLEVDNVWVRGRMHVYELLIHQIRATNGSIFVSNTGKVTAVSGTGPYTITTDPEHGFAVGDLIRAQRFTGTGVYQSNMQVTSVTSSKIFVATLSSGDAPAAGMDFVRLGSVSDANRRGGLYLTADDSGAPYLDIFDGVSSFGTWGTAGVIKTRLGKLDGLGLPGSYTGEYGLYAGDGTTDADAYIRLGNKTNRLNNLSLEWWVSGAKGAWVAPGEGLTFRAVTAYSVSRSIRFLGTDDYRLGALYHAGGPTQSGAAYTAVTADNNSSSQAAMSELMASNANASGSAFAYLSVAGRSAFVEVKKVATVTSMRLAADTVSVEGGEFYVPVGTQALPSITFTGDSNTGIYRYAADQLGITTGGAMRMYVGNALVYIGVPLGVTGDVNVTGALAATGAVSGTTGTFSSAVSGASGTFSGQLLATGGGVGISQGAPYLGVNIKAPTGGWTRGLNFRTSADAALGGFGAYGTADAINYFWIGNAYNDWSLRTYPTTGNTGISGTLDVAGVIKRGGTAGGIFVPMTPTNLTDTGSTVWSGVSRAAGTYTFDVNTAANGSVPTDAIAVAVMGTFTWTNSSNSTYATIQKPSAAYSIVARALGSGIASDVAGDVMLDANGQFTVTIVNATSNTSLLRIVGYYI